MKVMTITLVLLGMLWAGTTSAAPQKRGCSAYGHSCFGGYGKRAAGGLVLPLVPPPQPRGLRTQSADGDPDRPEGLPYLRSLRSPQDDEEAAFVVLRQSPVSSRTPLWGRPSAASARTVNGEDDDNGDQVAVSGGLSGGLGAGAVPASGRQADSAEDTDEPYANMASRLFLRRWLRTYRRAGERGSHISAQK